MTDLNELIDEYIAAEDDAAMYWGCSHRDYMKALDRQMEIWKQLESLTVGFADEVIAKRREELNKS